MTSSREEKALVEALPTSSLSSTVPPRSAVEKRSALGMGDLTEWLFSGHGGARAADLMRRERI